MGPGQICVSTQNEMCTFRWFSQNGICLWATHSSILAWKVPWTEEPGRLQSMELQRIRH